MRALRGFGRFWVDCVVGDDPKIALGVALALGLTGALVAWSSLGGAALTVVGGAAVVTAFVAGLVVDVRSARR